METPSAGSPVTVYWAPGCSSCLRVKEYLGSHGVAFRSRNIQSDPTAIADLAALGIRRVPIVTKGDGWADGQALIEVAQLCGIEFKAQAELSVQALAQRLVMILKESERAVSQFEPIALRDEIPDGNRTYADLSYHVFSVADVFLEHAAGEPVTFAAYSRVPQPDKATREDLLAFGADVRARVAHWFDDRLANFPWDARADVYYGEQTNRQFLERTAWHSGQHLRQLLWRLDTEQGSTRQREAQPLFDGLPMPNAVWHADAVG
ncbi:glutaredoxin domain-containing protein [Paraburkholderia caffeinilytica]|uniref:glutaredoxin domain-containing protein n=1 Tax=Paraburkholderia caffeinilytica TaxID=1761016 RepID=UPI0038B97943